VSSRIDRAQRRTRQDFLSSAEGFITQEPGNLGVVQSASIPVTTAGNGIAYFTMIGLRAGEVVTNLITYMTVNGAGLTLTKLALFDTTGVRLAVSADVSATFTSGAAKLGVVPLITPYAVPADGAYYAAWLSVGTTGPTLARGNGTFDAIATAGKARRFGKQASQTDMPSPATIIAGGPAFWFGVS
jgi:hypothetical protein